MQDIGSGIRDISMTDTNVEPKDGMMTELDLFKNGAASGPDLTSTCNKCHSLRLISKNSGDINNEANVDVWISCDRCEKWYHAACVGYSHIKDESELEKIEFFCCNEE